MPSPSDLQASILAWVKETFPLAQQQNISIESSLLDSGLIDSLGTLDVVQYLEETHGIIVSDEDMVADHFSSVEAIAALVDSKR